MTANQIKAKIFDFLKRFLAHRYLPVLLAIGAILVMLPAFKLGLVADDLPQRAVALTPDRLPPRMHDTGNPTDSGGFSTVLRDYFFHRSSQDMALMKSYGMLPWWAPDDLRLGLWRPVTAFTHWLDYQLFPDSPAPMHAENIACFAGIVFLLAIIYRRLMGAGWVAGLAALLFLLDGNTYFPVAFVANRGFMLSLFFGLLCLYEHHQWRSEKSRPACVLSALCLAVALFANEGGASSFAFILAYVLVLESGSLRSRALTLAPSILVIVLWKTIYTCAGFGVFHVGGYIDPANEPLLFAKEVIPRAMVLLAGQLPFLAPEVLFAVSPSLLPKVTLFYCALAAAFLAILFLWARRDKRAAFWFAVMVLAVIPAATVIPIGKNLGFVAVGAYGLIASFVAGVTARPSQLPASRTYRILAWTACAVLMLIHIPGAITGRVLAVEGTSIALNGLTYLSKIGKPTDVENKNVIVINAPCQLPIAYAPFDKAYRHQPLPKTMRTLVPGCTGFDVQRTDDNTLVIRSKAPNIFSCDQVGPVHAAYAFSAGNVFVGELRIKKGDRRELGGLTVDVLELDSSGLPSRVSFRFETSLESADFRWLWFDWKSFSYQPFKIPDIGQSITLSGPLR